jgi:hypothetical protein
MDNHLKVCVRKLLWPNLPGDTDKRTEKPVSSTTVSHPKFNHHIHSPADLCKIFPSNHISQAEVIGMGRARSKHGSEQECVIHN